MVGLNTTATEQLVFGTRLLGQLLVSLKSLLMVMLWIGVADAPVALRDTFCGRLEVPTV